MTQLFGLSHWSLHTVYWTYPSLDGLISLPTQMSNFMRYCPFNWTNSCWVKEPGFVLWFRCYPGARLKQRVPTSSPKKAQLVQKNGSKIKLTQEFQSVLKDIFEKVTFIWHCVRRKSVFLQDQSLVKRGFTYIVLCLYMWIYLTRSAYSHIMS